MEFQGSMVMAYVFLQICTHIIYLKSMILPPCVPMNKVMDQNIINEYGLHVFHWSYIINLRLATVCL